MSDKESTKSSWLKTTLEMVGVVVGTVLVVIVLRTYVIDNYYVPTDSMTPTVETDAHLIGFKLPFIFGNSTPDYDDIITFKDRTDPSKTLVKRVIAKPGDVVDIEYGHVVVNGEVKTDHEYGRTTRISRDIVFPYTVPENTVFVLGDNRENSSDSRVFGGVPINTITSKVIHIIN